MIYKLCYYMLNDLVFIVTVVDVASGNQVLVLIVARFM